MISKTTLSEIAEIIMGQSPSNDDVNDSNIGLPLLNGPTEFSDRHPNPVQFTIKGKKFAEPDDILFCVRGSTTGRMNYADQKYVIGRGIAAIRGKNGYPTPFVRAIIENNLDRILLSATGSTFPNVGKDLLNNFEIQTVSKVEAILISDLLVGLENKIEINRQINQTLEEIAQTIFKSWFVDFEPVKAKMAAKEKGQDPQRAAMLAISGKTEEAFEQLSPEQKRSLAETATLFPEAMQDSELGEIPEGWEVSRIGNEVDVFGGGTPSTKKKEFWDGGIFHWTTPKDLSGISEKIICNTPRKITKAGLKQISSGLLPVNTVLMSSRAPVGYLAITKVPIAINQGYIAMVCNKKLTPEYILQWANSTMDDIKQRASGTTFAEISKRNFKVIPIIIPTTDVLYEYSKFGNEFYNLTYENMKTIEQLSQIRDLILPKLLSGEIKLSHIESHNE